MDAIYDFPTWVLVTAILAAMFAANENGFQIGRRRLAGEPESSRVVSNGLKASILGLVALLLAFSYSMTSARFNQRQRLVLDEANAIGTCYLRAGLLAEPSRDRIQTALRQLTEARLEHFERALDPAEYQRTIKVMNVGMNDLWSGVAEAVTTDRDLARVSQIVPAANAVIDLGATRAWASHNHLPSSVLWLLAVCIVISAGIMGHSSGQAGARHLGLWITLNILITLVLFAALDFDRPRRGLIQIDHSPLIELQDSFKQTPEST